MRTILQRNPGAFRSKFVASEEPSKQQPQQGKESKKEDAELQQQQQQQVATHKNGCKCRKSECLRKYCECFNANIKCGQNCRCIGCKNYPAGGAPPGLNGRYGGVNGKGGWMMDAAQNLVSVPLFVLLIEGSAFSNVSTLLLFKIGVSQTCISAQASTTAAALPTAASLPSTHARFTS